MTFSPLVEDAATWRAFSAAFAARGTAGLRARVAELVDAAERATDLELCRRLERAAGGGFDLRDLLQPTPLENAETAIALEPGPPSIHYEHERVAALKADEIAGLLGDYADVEARRAA